MRFAFVTGLVLLLAALSGCASEPDSPLDPRTVPLNPNAMQVVSIAGAVAPGYSVPELVIIYAAAIPSTGPLPGRSCAAWVNHLEGVFGPKTIELHVPATSHGGEVSVKVQLDRYSPGPCNWRLQEVDAVVMDDGSSKRASFRIGYGLDFFQIASAPGSTVPFKPDDKVTFRCRLGQPNFFCTAKSPSIEGLAVMIGPSTKQFRFEVQKLADGVNPYS
jgi:hypothetical protein